MKSDKYRINGVDYDVAVSSCTGSNAEVMVNGVTYQVEIVKESAFYESQDLCEEPECHEVPAKDSAVTVPKPSDGGIAENLQITSPLPGVIVSIRVKPGDQVRSGQVVAILEAMKMENEIQSEYDGTVASVNVTQGDSILEGAPVVTIIK